MLLSADWLLILINRSWVQIPALDIRHNFIIRIVCLIKAESIRKEAGKSSFKNIIIWSIRRPVANQQRFEQKVVDILMSKQTLKGLYLVQLWK